MFEKYTNSFLNDFNFNNLLEKFDNKKFITFHEGDLLYCENSPVTEIYFILSGEVILSKLNLNSESETVTLSGSGDILGFYDALTNREHSNSAVALQDTNVFAVDTDDLLKLVNRKDEFNLWALNYLSRKLEAIDKESEHPLW